MKKRFVRLIALSLTLIILLSTAVMAVSAFAADTKDEKYNFYVSDFLVEDSMNLTQTMIQGEFPTPYHHIYETLSKDVAWNLTMAAWSFLTFDFSDIVKITDKSIGFYEAILFDIFCDAQKSEESISDAELSSFSTALEVSKLIVEDYGDVLAIPLEDLKKDSEKYESIMSSIVDSELLAGALGEFKDILKYGSTLNEVITNCARLESLVCSYNNSIQILNDISAKTSDDNLKMACKRFAGYLNENIGSITYTVISAVEESAYALADFLIGKLWNIVCTELNGYGFVIEAGQKLGKLASNLLFSTEESKEHYYAICALHEFEKCLCLCVGDYQSNYIKSRTYENSALFNESFFLLGKTIVEGCEYAVKYYEITYEHGFANQAINAFIKGSEWLKHVFNDNYEIPKRDYEVYIEEVGVVKSRFISNMDFIENDCYECYLNSIEDIGNEIEVEHKPPVNTQEEIIQFNLEMQELCYKLSNVYIEKNKTLTEDMTIYGDLYMSANIDLNGHALNVIGNVYQTGGTMTINNGMLNVAGDYRIQEETINDKGEVEYSSVYAHLVMENDKDTVNVGGSFITRARDNYSHTLTAGTLSIGGDVYDWESDIYASGTHKTILNGTEKQMVYFNSKYSYFNILEATDIECSGYFKANSLNSDMTITSDDAVIEELLLNGKTVTINGSLKCLGFIDFDGGNLIINFDVEKYPQYPIMDLEGGTLTINGDVILSNSISLNGGKLTINGDVEVNTNAGNFTTCLLDGTLAITGDVKLNNSIYIRGSTLNITGNVDMTKDIDLNGGTMNVNGTLRQTGGDMQINNGTLNITGDYRIQEETINENGEVEYSCAYDACLVMENDNDTVNVGGSFITRAMNYDDNFIHTLKAGTLSVGGDIYDWKSNIQASGTHKTILNGTVKQTVYFDSNSSYFNILKANDFVCTGYFSAAPFDSDMTITSDGAKIWGIDFKGHTLTINGVVELIDNINLYGETMTVNGTLRQTNGTMTINGGTLNITEDYRIQEETINENGEVEYSTVFAYLVMENDNDTVNIGGSFITRVGDSAYYNSSHTLTAGTLSVGGDIYDGKGNIQASGTHKTILNGTGKQTVYLGVYSSHFNILEATDVECNVIRANTIISDMTIAPIPNRNGVSISDIDLNGKKLTINGDAYVEDIDLNGGTITVNGNMVMYGSMDLNGGTMTIYGVAEIDHSIDFNGGTMTIYGNVEMSNSIDLSGGTMNVNGNVLHTYGDMTINNGTLNITGEYRIQEKNNYYGEEGYYSTEDAYLVMENDKGTVNIGGDFITELTLSRYYNRKYPYHPLTAGTLSIGGNVHDYGGDIQTSGTHKTILNGTGEQLVDFSYSSSYFGTLEITQKYSNYCFSSYYYTNSSNELINCWKKLIISKENAKIKEVSYSPTIGDEIGMDFYLVFSDDVLANDTAEICMSVIGRKTITVAVSDAEKTDLGYRFTYPVAAADLKKLIYLDLDINGSEVDSLYPCTVSDAMYFILAHESLYPNEAAIVNAMLNYGGATEKYFTGSTEIRYQKPAVLKDKLSAYAFTITDDDADIDFVGQVLNLGSKVKVKLYFSGKDFKLSDFTVMHNGSAVDTSRLTLGSDDKGTYLEISEINAYEMGEAFTITVGDVTISNYSVYSYILVALYNSDEDLRNVTAALYVYGCAAEEYAKNAA